MVEDVRGIEAELEKMASKTAERLAAGARDGTIAAGGFSSTDSLLIRVARPNSFLSSLSTSPLPASKGASSFRNYASLLDDLDTRERAAMALVVKAKKKLSSLEKGAFQTVGYGSYEEMLERVLSRLPHLATTLLATDERFSCFPAAPPPAPPPAAPAPTPAPAPAPAKAEAAPPKPRPRALWAGLAAVGLTLMVGGVTGGVLAARRHGLSEHLSARASLAQALHLRPARASD